MKTLLLSLALFSPLPALATTLEAPKVEWFDYEPAGDPAWNADKLIADGDQCLAKVKGQLASLSHDPKILRAVQDVGYRQPTSRVELTYSINFVQKLGPHRRGKAPETATHISRPALHARVFIGDMRWDVYRDLPSIELASKPDETPFSRSAAELEKKGSCDVSQATLLQLLQDLYRTVPREEVETIRYLEEKNGRSFEVPEMNPDFSAGSGSPAL